MADKIKTLPGGRMGTAEAAQYLGLSYDTLNKLRCHGKGPRYLQLNGKRVFYRQCDLDQYLAQSVVETADSRRASA